jgi:hypothetical protein
VTGAARRASAIPLFTGHGSLESGVDERTETLCNGCSDGAVASIATRAGRHRPSALVREIAMRLDSPLSLVAYRRPAASINSTVRMRAPSRLPTIVPTRSSYLQRFLWLFGLSR